MRPDESGLKRKLGRLDARRQTAFGAAIAQRMFSACDHYWKDESFTAQERGTTLLDALWRWLDGTLEDEVDFVFEGDQLEAEFPLKEGAPFSAGDAFAPEMVNALHYACDCILGYSDVLLLHASRAAMQGIKNQLLVGPDGGLKQDLGAEPLDDHPLVKAEKARQIRDAKMLRKTPDRAFSEAVRALRARAIQEGSSMLGDLP